MVTIFVELATPLLVLAKLVWWFALVRLLVVLVYPLVVLVFPLLLLVCPFVCPLAVLVCPLVVSVCPLVVLSVSHFITDLNFIVYLNIIFQLNCLSKLSWSISLKEIFGFQKLKSSFSEILFQKKPPHSLLILLF